MKILITLLSISTMIFSASCTKTDKADLVIINGKILTIDEENTEAIAVKDDIIIAVGTTKKISRMIRKGTQRLSTQAGDL